MLSDWFTASRQSSAQIAASSIFLRLLLSIRITGLRTFSKMAGIEFAVTIAAGAVLASTVTSATTVVEGAVALSTLLAFQALTAIARRRQRFAAVIENRPLLLMAGDEFLQDNLRRVRLSLEGVKAKLREPNVVRYGQVLAVVLETTGDISVLHGGPPMDRDLLDGVIGAERLVGGAQT